MIWWAPLCYPVHRAGSRGVVEDAHVLGVEILTERYSGFHHGTMGTFLVRFRLLYYPTVPTFYCNSSSFALYLFGTSYTFIISVFYFSRDPFEPIPTSPKIRGIRDTLAFLSQLQVLGSTRWYGLRRENESSRVGVWTIIGSGAMQDPNRRHHCRGGPRRSNNHSRRDDSQQHRGRGRGRSLQPRSAIRASARGRSTRRNDVIACQRQGGEVQPPPEEYSRFWLGVSVIFWME